MTSYNDALNDFNDKLNDQLLNCVPSYNDHWMSSLTVLMTSYWNAWHHKVTHWMISMTKLMTSYWTACYHIMTIEWLQWQSWWPVTEYHDIIWWPLNELNDNLDDQLLNSMISLNDPLNEFNDKLNDQLLNCVPSYNDHWMSSMTILMTSYWIAWHHIMTIEWVQ